MSCVLRLASCVLRTASCVLRPASCITAQPCVSHACCLHLCTITALLHVYASLLLTTVCPTAHRSYESHQQPACHHHTSRPQLMFIHSLYFFMIYPSYTTHESLEEEKKKEKSRRGEGRGGGEAYAKFLLFLSGLLVMCDMVQTKYRGDPPLRPCPIPLTTRFRIPF